MNSVYDILNRRRSIRVFKSKPVTTESLEKILLIAGGAPSAGNTQPWEVVIAQGEPLDKIRAENERLFRAETPPRTDISNRFYNSKVTDIWPPKLAKRYQERGRDILDSQNIARNDKAARNAFYTQMHRYFEAPAVLFLGFDKQLHEGYSMFDLGLFAQSFCLAALGEGLGTCIEAIGVFYPDVLRAHLPVPEHLQLVAAIAIGYPDWNAPVNTFARDTAPLDEWVHGL